MMVVEVGMEEGRKGGREGWREREREGWREGGPTCAASSMKMWVKYPLGKPMRGRALAVLSVATTIWYCRSSCIEGMVNLFPSILEWRVSTYTIIHVTQKCHPSRKQIIQYM